MCEPVTLGLMTTAITAGATGTAAGAAALGMSAALGAPAALALGSMAGASVMSAAATYQQGQVQKQIAQNNAVMSEYAAQDAQRRGEEDAMAIQRRASQLSGTQRAVMAGRGLDLETGTAADILDQTDFFAQQDVNTARYNAARDAWSYRARGQQGLYEGRAAARNASMQAAGTLLGTAGSVADKWKT
jgi:hypothetical protein